MCNPHISIRRTSDTYVENAFQNCRNAGRYMSCRYLYCNSDIPSFGKARTSLETFGLKVNLRNVDSYSLGGSLSRSATRLSRIARTHQSAIYSTWSWCVFHYWWSPNDGQAARRQVKLRAIGPTLSLFLDALIDHEDVPFLLEFTGPISLPLVWVGGYSQPHLVAFDLVDTANA